MQVKESKRVHRIHLHLRKSGPDDRTGDIAEKEEGDDQDSRHLANIKF